MTCHNCVTFVECGKKYGKPHPHHTYICHIQGHNPVHSSKYWSDPLCAVVILVQVVTHILPVEAFATWIKNLDQ